MGLSPDRPHECRSYEVEKGESLERAGCQSQTFCFSDLLTLKPSYALLLGYLCQRRCGCVLDPGAVEVFHLTVSFVISKFVLSIPVLSRRRASGR